MSRRGQTFFDVLIALAIAIMALACVCAYMASRTPGSSAAARSALPAAIEEARTVAESSGGGATLALAQEPRKAGSRTYFDLVLYRYRPQPGSPFDRTRPERAWRVPGAFAASTGPGPLGIFISSSGTVSYQVWKPGDPPLQSEPPCTGPLGLVVAGDAALLQGAPSSPPPLGNGLTWFALACGDARLVEQ